MRTGLRNALLSGLLIAAAGLTWWWSRPEPIRSAAESERSEALGYYMLDAVVSLANAEGREEVLIRTARLAEFPDEDRLQFEDLVVEQRLDGRGWRVTAQRATGPTDTSALGLEGNVELTMDRAEDGPIVIRAPRLTFDLLRSSARSSGPVEVLTGRLRYTAEELEVDLNAQSLRLESVRGMNITQLTSAVAMVAVGAAAAAQEGGDGVDRVDGPNGSEEAASRFLETSSLECEGDQCVLGEAVFTGENWRIEAREARHTGDLDEIGDSEVRLADVHFEIEDMTLDTPSAVFEFADNRIAKAALSGDDVRFEVDDATFTAHSVVFSFADGELATAELTGDPATLVDRSERRDRPPSATADTIAYDYREHTLRMVGRVVFERGGDALSLDCLSYDFDTERFTSCSRGGTLRILTPTTRGDSTDASAP